MFVVGFVHLRVDVSQKLIESALVWVVLAKASCGSSAEVRVILDLTMIK